MQAVPEQSFGTKVSQNVPTVAVVISALIVCPIMIGIVVQSSMNAWKKYKNKKKYGSED